MRPVRLILAAALGALLALISISAGQAAATPSPYPPTTCPTLSVSTTTPFPGQLILVAGNNFAAGQHVTIVMESAPVTLGTATANASGQFMVQVRIPADARGNHVITVAGNSSGCPVSPIQIVVGGGLPSAAGGAGGGGGGGLAFTGFDALLVAAIALGLIGLGLVLSRTGSRRRYASHR